MAEIVIDCREIKLIDFFQKNYITTNIIVKQLDIGDILIVNSEEIPVLIFERKTLSDLIASIRDGRYHEQKLRMLSNFQSRSIYYIIEGSEITNPVIYSAICNTLIRDNINILRTFNIKETIEIIIHLQNSLIKFKNKDQCQEKEHNYENVIIQARKKDNLTKEIVFLKQLTTIPGIGPEKAKIIANKYPCMKSLLTALENNEKIISDKLDSTLHEFLL